MVADCPVAERVRDALLNRFDLHFARDEVRDELRERLDVAPPVLTAAIQAVALRLFPEAFDVDARGLVTRQGVGRVSRPMLAAFAAALDA